jgi:hypothetical protein
MVFFFYINNINKYLTTLNTLSILKNDLLSFRSYRQRLFH